MMIKRAGVGGTQIKLTRKIVNQYVENLTL